MTNSVLTCPGCGRPVGRTSDNGPADADDTPPTGACLACSRCNALFMFDGAAWREPTADERKQILADEDMVQVLSMQQELALWEERDRDRIRECVMPYLIALAASTTTVDMAAADIGATLWNDGFHTHPDMEVPEDE